MVLITKTGSKITTGAMKYKSKNVAQRIFDLKEHTGERIRVHIDTSGKYTLGIKPRQGLLVCELDVPKREFEHTEKVVDGETVIESKEKALKLEEITMKEYLKEVEKGL